MNANTFNDLVTHSIHVSANANTFNDSVTHSNNNVHCVIYVSANANIFNDWVTHSNNNVHFVFISVPMQTHSIAR